MRKEKIADCEQTNRFYKKFYKRAGVILSAVLLLLSTLFSACGEVKINLPIESGVFSVHYLDVGQGDSIFINFPDGKNMLIDAGIKDDATADYIVKCIEKSDTETLDYLLLTHPDGDHIGNAEAIIKRFSVGKIFAPKINDASGYPEFAAAIECAVDKKTPVIVPDFYTSESGDDWFLAFLSPVPSGMKGSAYDGFNSIADPSAQATNDLSPIVYLECNGVRFMFTGDAGESQELLVLQNFRSGLYDNIFGNDRIKLNKVDFLKVSHHGSNSASGEEFLGLLTPGNAVISVGKNYYGLPSTAVLKRLIAQSPEVKIYRTDVGETISVTVDSNGLYTVSEGIK